MDPYYEVNHLIRLTYIPTCSILGAERMVQHEM